MNATDRLSAPEALVPEALVTEVEQKLAALKLKSKDDQKTKIPYLLLCKSRVEGIATLAQQKLAASEAKLNAIDLELEGRRLLREDSYKLSDYPRHDKRLKFEKKLYKKEREHLVCIAAMISGTLSSIIAFICQIQGTSEASPSSGGPF